MCNCKLYQKHIISYQCFVSTSAIHSNKVRVPFFSIHTVFALYSLVTPLCNGDHGMMSRSPSHKTRENEGGFNFPTLKRDPACMMMRGVAPTNHKKHHSPLSRLHPYIEALSLER
jgi:hypothetical protein